jgi:hypothetical protein
MPRMLTVPLWYTGVVIQAGEAPVSKNEWSVATKTAMLVVAFALVAVIVLAVVVQALVH